MAEWARTAAGTTPAPVLAEAAPEGGAALLAEQVASGGAAAALAEDAGDTVAKWGDEFEALFDSAFEDALGQEVDREAVDV